MKWMEAVSKEYEARVAKLNTETAVNDRRSRRVGWESWVARSWHVLRTEEYVAV